MGWRIIEIESGEQLNLFINNLVIKKENEKILIPIKDIDVLLINNYMAKITINLINELTANNVVVIICDNKYLPSSNIVPIVGNYNTLKVLQEQIKWTNKYKAKLWKQIISLKINNQYNFLKYLNIDEELINQLIILKDNIQDFDISNREGHASKIYWHSLFGIKFKRHEDDYCNLLLNYGYTILRSYVTRSIIKKGLDPRISIFHKSFHNYFALASDLMEPFRIIVDIIVYKIMQTNKIEFYKHKEELIMLFNKKIIINDTNQFVNNAIDIFIDTIVSQIDLPTIEIDYNEWI